MAPVRRSFYSHDTAVLAATLRSYAPHRLCSVQPPRLRCARPFYTTTLSLKQISPSAATCLQGSNLEQIHSVDFFSVPTATSAEQGDFHLLKNRLILTTTRLSVVTQ
eukprot:Gb_30900 [translate_table: standard]